MRRGLLVVAVFTALASPAHAGGPAMRIGAAEDAVKQPTLVGAKAQLTLAKLAGFDTVRITAIWSPGQVTMDAGERDAYTNLDAAARLAGVRVVVSVYHYGSRTTPLTEERRTEFARFAAGIVEEFPEFRDVIVGNEPNLNRFWMPQFGPAGENVAAPAYLELLAATYDAVKAASPRTTVWGGALAPRGIDRPGSGRDTHSPTAFIRDLGAAYRASERVTPVMDGLAMHPYCDTSSQAPVNCTHPRTNTIGIGDYDKLVKLLGEAFDGTAQRGSTLPILYDEFGVESVIPAAKATVYTGSEPATIKPVPEATQAEYYRQAVAMAFCQPNVRGLLLFHVVDEKERPAWQSGVFYADGTRKSSLPGVRKASAESRRGVVAKCPGMKLTPKATLRQRGNALTLSCDLDCGYDGTIGPRRVRAIAVGGAPHRIVPRPALKRGTYAVVLRYAAAVNPGAPKTLRTTFRVG